MAKRNVAQLLIWVGCAFSAGRDLKGAAEQGLGSGSTVPFARRPAIFIEVMGKTDVPLLYWDRQQRSTKEVVLA